MYKGIALATAHFLIAFLPTLAVEAPSAHVQGSAQDRPPWNWGQFLLRPQRTRGPGVMTAPAARGDAVGNLGGGR